MTTRRFQNVDVLLEVITEDEILYFLNNIASRLMVPVRNENGSTSCEDVITVCMNGPQFQLNTETFYDSLEEAA